MADNEIKTLGKIKEELSKANAKQEALQNQLDKNYRAFPAEKFKSLTEEQAAGVKKMRADLKAELENVGKEITSFDLQKQVEGGMFDSLAKFLGVDYVSETFRRLDKIGQGFADIKKGFQDLGKALGLDKVKKAAGGFWDFLKKLFAVGLATVGFIKFIEGWNKVNKYFEGNIDFSERLSSALATVIGSFTGLTEGEIGELAVDINETIESLFSFLSKEFNGFTATFREMIPNFKQTFNGFAKILEGDFLGGITDITGGVLGLGEAMLTSDSMLVQAAGILLGIKLVGAATSFATSIGPIFTALSTIGSGIATIFTALGGKAAFTAAMATLAPTLGSILIPLGLALAAVVALKSIFDGFSAGYEEFKQSGDISQALSAGLGGFVKSLLNMLTLGLLSDETLDNVEKVIKDTLDPIFESIGDLFQHALSWITGSWDSLKFKFKNFFGLATDEEKIAEAMRKQDTVAAIDNQLLKSTSSYDSYINSLKDNQALSQEQRDKELAEARAAREAGQSYAEFRNTQVTTNNNAIITKITPENKGWTSTKGQTFGFEDSAA